MLLAFWQNALKRNASAGELKRAIASAERLTSVNKSSRSWVLRQAWRHKISSGSSCTSSVKELPTCAKICSNTQRMVKTVGPESTNAPPTLICRILPPGAAADSTSVTRTPLCASSKALTRPPTPAPTTITCLVLSKAAFVMRRERSCSTIALATPAAGQAQRHKAYKHGLGKKPSRMGGLDSGQMRASAGISVHGIHAGP